MVEDLSLLPRDRALYEKLHASHSDIAVAQSCAEYLLKKKWHTHSFMRRGSIPIQQTAFTTAMVVSYARPFSPGRASTFTFPHKLLQYDAKATLFHKRLLTLRNEQYAHTDPSTASVRPLKGEFITSIQSISSERFSAVDLKMFVSMTGGVMDRIQERIRVIRLSGW